MKYPMNLATGTLVIATIGTAVALGGCASQTPAKPSKALIYWTPPPASESSQMPRFELTLASGDGAGMQMRDVFLARARGESLDGVEPVIVQQTEP